MKPYLAIIFAATDAPKVWPGRGVGSNDGGGEGSCSDGGGAIATPPALGLSISSSSLSLSRLPAPANPVGIPAIFFLRSSLLLLPGSKRLKSN